MNAFNGVKFPYDWPCRGITPADKQQLTTMFAVWNPHSFILNDPGTGKTLSALWAADFVMSQYPRYNVRSLILAPLSALDKAWRKEINNHFFMRRSCVIVHGSVKKRLKALNTTADFYIMNFDGVKIRKVYEKLMAMGIIKIVIVDECTAFKDYGITRSKRARELLHHRPYLWLMSGTPTPQGPMDAHGQARLCHPAYKESKTAYKGRIMTQYGPFKFVANPNAYDEARAILQPSIRIPRHAMHDLPPSIPSRHHLPFSAAQERLYKELKAEMRAVLDGGSGAISAVHEGVLRLKLLQIAAGVVYDAQRVPHIIDSAPRLRQLAEIIHDWPDKLLVFASFTSVLTFLHSAFRKRVPCEMVNGQVSLKERSRIFGEFQDSDKGPKVIFADPRCMAHALTLTRATVTLWYGPTDSNEIYTQANYRIDRPGKTKDTFIYQFSSCKVEAEIYDRLEARQSLQGTMLKMMEAEDA